MKHSSKIFFTWVAGLVLAGTVSAADTVCSEVLDFERKPLAGEGSINLCEHYRGKVIVVVNTASKCGYTYQYEGLEQLYSRYEAQGLVVLGFPSNDFANQEPGSADQIKTFCRLTYGVKFPMFAKTRVARGTDDPLFRALARHAGEYPQWNFHKYLIDRQGRVAASYASKVEPLGGELEAAVKGLL
ncbi:glutathione peroxidase [Candidatus Tenderia electrophaga]|jgi:glutathione peroxidase|uniref:Glutathione peroxidase n=1 Tax=Candidatus Tenderia electrophaga TaxID=1748243 RepID=A0A0S2TC47_9GAMM|nr:glutathione peroxidase [Candidatus Tenderia electrophaga]